MRSRNSRVFSRPSFLMARRASSFDCRILACVAMLMSASNASVWVRRNPSDYPDQGRQSFLFVPGLFPLPHSGGY